MAILPWPATLRNPNSVRLALAANTQSGGRSPFDQTEQTLELPGAHWTAEIRWQNLPDSHWRIMQAFVANLGGRAGRFLWGPPHIPRKGTRTGAAFVVGANQTGKTLNTGGWTGAGNAFLTGDLVGYVDPTGRNVFHMVTADATVDVSNASAVAIAPAIRRSPANAAPLVLVAPKAVWRLTDDVAGLDYERGVYASVSLQIEEAVF